MAISRCILGSGERGVPFEVEIRPEEMHRMREEASPHTGSTRRTHRDPQTSAISVLRNLLEVHRKCVIRTSSSRT